MSSRKEQKEQLRREREEREQAAKEAERRRRMIGYAAAGALVLVVLVVGVVLLAGGDDGSGEQADGGSDVLPDGGEVPDPEITDLQDAARAAGCTLTSRRAASRDHTQDLAEQVAYPTNPPTAGRHFEVPAEDGAYDTAPDAKELVHSLEHGRIIVWVKKTLPRAQRANLKALFDEDTFQMLIVPNETNMPYAVAASAWNAEPQPLGTGRLLGCRRYSPQVFDAIRAFKDEHRSNGPEAVP